MTMGGPKRIFPGGRSDNQYTWCIERVKVESDFMHEMSLCESILDVIEQQAREQRFTKVKTVRLEIGALSSVEPEAMRFCFDAVMRGSLADRARLEIIDIEGRAWCRQCGHHVVIRQRYDACPACGGLPLRVDSGEEMRIKELEVE